MRVVIAAVSVLWLSGLAPAASDSEVLASGPLSGELSHLNAREMELEVVQFPGSRYMGWRMKPTDQKTFTGFLMNEVMQGVVMGEATCQFKESERPLLLPSRSEPVTCDVGSVDRLVSWPHYRMIVAAIWRLAARRPGGDMHVAMLGLGCGAVVNYLHRACDFVSVIDVAEIEPLIVKYARKFFEVRPDDRLKVHLQGGAEFLKAAPLADYDVFINDASGSQLDFLTPWAIRLIWSKLKDDGIMIVNANEWQAGLSAWMRHRILDFAAPFFAEIWSNIDVIVFLRAPPPSAASFDASAPEYVKEWMDPDKHERRGDDELREWIVHRGFGMPHVLGALLALLVGLCGRCCLLCYMRQRVKVRAE